jgi:hypothetical protein
MFVVAFLILELLRHNKLNEFETPSHRVSKFQRKGIDHGWIHVSGAVLAARARTKARILRHHLDLATPCCPRRSCRLYDTGAYISSIFVGRIRPRASLSPCQNVTLEPATLVGRHHKIIKLTSTRL